MMVFSYDMLICLFVGGWKCGMWSVGRGRNGEGDWGRWEGWMGVNGQTLEYHAFFLSE